MTLRLRRRVNALLIRWALRLGRAAGCDLLVLPRELGQFPEREQPLDWRETAWRLSRQEGGRW